MVCGCKKSEDRKCWKAKGDNINVSWTLPPFQHLNLSGGMHYFLVQDSLDYIEVSGGENLVGFIEANVDDEVLYISDENTCNFLRSYPNEIEVYIHFTNLSSVFNTSYNQVEGRISKDNGVFNWDNWDGSTDIDLELNCDTIHVALHTGAPSFIVSGMSNFGYLYTAGSGYSDGSDLVLGGGQAHNVGIGDIKINVDGGSLNCVLESGGNIYYTGTPSSIMEDNSGSGAIISF